MGFEVGTFLGMLGMMYGIIALRDLLEDARLHQRDEQRLELAFELAATGRNDVSFFRRSRNDIRNGGFSPS